VYCVCAKLQFTMISQFSHQFISNLKLAWSQVRPIRRSPYLCCRPPTWSHPQPIVFTLLWFLCSRRQKSYSEFAGLNIYKPNIRQSISVLDEVICAPVPRRIFTNLKSIQQKVTNSQTMPTGTPPLTGAKIAIFDQYLALASITAGSIVTIALSRFRRVSL